MSRAKQHVSTVEIVSTAAERRYLDKIKEEYSFDETELHLFCWYVGYRVCLDNFLGRGDSNPPTEAAVNKFIERHKKPH